MSGNTECLISFGAGVKVKWRQSENGSLTVSIRPNEVEMGKSGSLTFHAAQIGENKILFYGESAGRQIEGDGDSNISTRVSNDVSKLREKIEKKWETSKKESRLPTDDQIARWSEDPSQFFGKVDFESSEQWSWSWLRDVKKGVLSLRAPFHKANLSLRLCSRIAKAKQIDPGILEVHCRRLMLSEICPGYEHLPRKNKLALYTQFERYLNQGDAFRILAHIRPGLLLTVAPLLTRRDLELVLKFLPNSYDSHLPWLNPQILDESTKYDFGSLQILGYMAQWVQTTYSVPSSLPPNRALVVAESSFRNIKMYFENTCRKIHLDNYGVLLNAEGTELRNDLCNDFDSYCFTATMFKERNLLGEFRHALSKACDLVERIIRAEHPRTLACFLEVFIHLVQTGLPDVALLLRSFVRKMSAQVTTTSHPWGQIYQLLGELDPEFLDQTLAQVWRCSIDTLERQLGTLGDFMIAVRLDYVKRVYGFTNYCEEERLLQGVLAQFEGIPRMPTLRVMLNLAHNWNKQGRHDEAEAMAQQVLCLISKNTMYVKAGSERIECKKIAAYSQFRRGKVGDAERTMRDAIRMVEDLWGIQHPWVLEFTTVLEGWLRSRIRG